MQKTESSPECTACHSSESRRNWAIASLEGQDVLRTVVPLQNKPSCQTCHGTTLETLGINLVDFHLNDFRRATTSSILQIAGGGVLTFLLMLVALYWLLNRLTIRPLRQLVGSTQAVTRGEWAERVPVGNSDEIGRLGMAFNEMAQQLGTTYTDLRQTLTEREEKAQSLQQALDDVQRGRETQDRLMAAIREISTPVVPVLRGILVMPLIGIIDSARAQNILEALLAAIEKERARVVILDITGVPMVDTAVAQALIQAARAARLLGADPVLVGITPQVAETIVALGVDLSDLVTRADLQSGVEYALRRLRPAS